MKLMTIQEAARFLKMSRSSLYQRRDIPRFRRPGSRALLFDQDELEAWVRTGRIKPMSIADLAGEPHLHFPSSSNAPASISAVSSIKALDIQSTDVYHRNPRYR